MATEVRCRGGCLRTALLVDGKLPACWKSDHGKPYCPICSVEIRPQDVHVVTIIRIKSQEFNVLCENTECDFNQTKTSRELAKIAAFSHLTDLIPKAG